MLNFLYRFCPFVIPMVICMFIYSKIDKHDTLTKKISSHLKVKEQWKAFCFVCFMFLVIIISGIIGMFTPIPEYAYSIFCGIIAGFCIPIALKLDPSKKKSIN
ncbi:hypothetical protein [Inconstantimicrobium porci]|uniref:Uncharacterized protein n=1 Tax=Inconstantimicrobium porci TaxID=2652291 RepID=A0A7X2MZN8_9CLOT|nr:hypothetical protein [Inconstantimicrobium porci]MSR92061.1 hypothetical protein [Inconstantimicrobium porci]